MTSEVGKEEGKKKGGLFKYSDGGEKNANREAAARGGRDTEP